MKTLIIKISFGGIPISRNVFLLKRVARPSAGNTSGWFPWAKLPQIPLNLTRLCTKASQTFSGTFSGTLLNLTCAPKPPDLLRNLLRNPVEPHPALHQSLPDLLWNLLRNPVEPDLALRQSLPEASPEPSSEPCWTWPHFPPKPPSSGTFSGTLLNLTWLCTKASQTFSATFSGSLQYWTWLCTKASQTFSGTFFGTLLSLTWSAPKPPGTSKRSRPSPEPLDLAWLCTKASQTFSGTFSGTVLNLIWLCTKASQKLLRNVRNLLRNLDQPDPAPAPVHTGAILGWRPHYLTLLGNKTIRFRIWLNPF